MTLNCAGVGDGRNSNHCVVRMSLLAGAATVPFGFIQVCEAYALQTAECLNTARRPALQSLQ